MNELQLDPNTQLVTVNDPSPTISVLWDRAVQQAVINTRVGPTIASRAYSMVHTAIYDAWAAYDPLAVGTQLGDDLQRPESENTEANKAEAMSFSAYRVLTDLFPDQVEIFNDVMVTLGFDIEDLDEDDEDMSDPSVIGELSAEALLAFRQNDGSNQQGNDPNGDGTPYSDISGYQPQNPAGDPTNIELWAPENVPIDDPNAPVQNFLTAHWGNVTPFGLESGDELRPVAPEPFLLVDGEVDLDAGTITLADQSVVPISKDIIGTIINPEFIAQTEEVVNFSANLTDEQKLIAEFWEDGGSTSYPPGTWMSFGQFVSARDEHTLDQDVELFFNLGNAVFDAGVATWEAKVHYDYARPVRTVRELGEQGLIGEFNEELGGFAIEAWVPGQGTQTILATDFLTYQTPGSDPSPPFAEYVSGHSTFSAAGAEILQRFTGDDEFGASVTFAPGESRFEPGVTPTETVTLEWESFSEASDEAGFSRLYGGIHFEDGDVNGRSLGRQVAGEVWEEAQSLLTPNKIMGTRRDDELIGTDVNDYIHSGPGNDTIEGLDGNDLIHSGKGDDIINAGGGRDIIGADRGDDIITGGTGADMFDFRSDYGNDIITDFEDGIDLIRLRGGLEFEDLTIAQVGSDTSITGDELSITLQGVVASDIGSNDFVEILA
ncbi:MAG: DUF6851 domain-containing protein [Cyanobacteria bacterium P01_H01_bin.35]